MRTARIGTLLCVAALALGCSSSPPEISRVFHQIILVHDLQAGTYSSRLSVFVVGNDPDGNDTLSDLYVINDDAELYWTVSKKDWSTANAEGESWLGTNDLRMPQGAAFPTGTYRVVLEGEGGDTAEQSFDISDAGPDPSKVTYPSVNIRDGEIHVSSSGPTPELWVFTNDGRFIARFSSDGTNGATSASGSGATPVGPAAAVPVGQPNAAAAHTTPQPPTPAVPVTIEGIAASNPTLAAGFSFWVYAYDPQQDRGLLVGPYPSGSLR